MKYESPEQVWDGIDLCADHPKMVDGCETCDKELEAMNTRLGSLIKETTDIARDISHNGGPMMPPSVMLEARLDVLIDSLFTDMKDRMRFEGEVGRRVYLSAKNMQAQIKQPVLHVAKGIPDNIRLLK